MVCATDFHTSNSNQPTHPPKLLLSLASDKSKWVVVTEDKKFLRTTIHKKGHSFPDTIVLRHKYIQQSYIFLFPGDLM